MSSADLPATEPTTPHRQLLCAHPSRARAVAAVDSLLDGLFATSAVTARALYVAPSRPARDEVRRLVDAHVVSRYRRLASRVDILTFDQLPGRLSAGLLAADAGLFAARAPLTATAVHAAARASVGASPSAAVAIDTFGVDACAALVARLIATDAPEGGIELAPPPDFRAALDDCAMVRSALLKIVHQVPLTAAEWLRRVAGDLAGLEWHLGRNGIAGAGQPIVLRLATDLAAPLPRPVAERLRGSAAAVEAARSRLALLATELTCVDAAHVEAAVHALEPSLRDARAALGLGPAAVLRAEDVLRCASAWGAYASVVVDSLDRAPAPLVDALFALDTHRAAPRLLLVRDPSGPFVGAAARWGGVVAERPWPCDAAPEAAAGGPGAPRGAVPGSAAAGAPVWNAGSLAEAEVVRGVAAIAAACASDPTRPYVLVITSDPAAASALASALGRADVSVSVDPWLGGVGGAAVVRVVPPEQAEGARAELVVVWLGRGSAATDWVAVRQADDGFVVEVESSERRRTSWGPHRLLPAASPARDALDAVAIGGRAAESALVVVSGLGEHVWSLVAPALALAGATTATLDAAVALAASVASQGRGSREPRASVGRLVAARERTRPRRAASDDRQGQLFVDTAVDPEDAEVALAIRALLSAARGPEVACESSS